MSGGRRPAAGYMGRLMRIFTVIVLFCIVVFAGIYAGLQTRVIEKVEKKYLYPYQYEEFINKYAKEYNVDSSLVAGVILAESRFTINAQSHRGAVGLMQIMPETGDWIANHINDSCYTTGLLYDPETNIHYGIWYMSFLLNRFENNEVLALASYNAGHGQVELWCEVYHWDKSFKDYTQIPYKETREYVKKVLDNKKAYQKLYKENNSNK